MQGEQNEKLAKPILTANVIILKKVHYLSQNSAYTEIALLKTEQTCRKVCRFGAEEDPDRRKGFCHFRKLDLYVTK